MSLGVVSVGLGVGLMSGCFPGSHRIGGVASVGAGIKINVLILIIRYQFNSLGWLFDQLFAWAPQHWWSSKSRSRYKDKCINFNQLLSIQFYGLVV